ENSDLVDQSSFWDSNGVHWDQHRIGWAIASGCAALSVLITLFSVSTRARNYRNRAEQRQIIRILYMPAIYGIISFLSFRFFRDHTYYSLVEVVYEAVTISAFLLLLIQYVAATASGSKAQNALLRKDKHSLLFPFCFWRFRPTKVIYFMYTIKWCHAISPFLCVIGIITQALGVLCVQIYSPHFAEVYIVAIDFVSISVALYGLILFYNLTRTELVDCRPLAQFLCIKGTSRSTASDALAILILTRSFIVSSRNTKSSTRPSSGLNVLATTIEMVFFAGLMPWVYPASEYKEDSLPKTSIWRPLWDSFNYTDFGHEIFGFVAFFVRYLLGRPNTHTPKGNSYPAQSSYQGVQIPQASTS
ncbi:hypothetical protein M422DRAFT_170543, partial [Sphaerobolus stellatus SS14]